MDLISKIEVPKGFNYEFLDGICEYAYLKTRDTLPFKTGWMSRYCFDYIVDNNYIILVIPEDKCPYAKYLEYDIPRTRGFWERATKIFSCYVNLDFKRAEKLSEQTEDLYGLRFNNMRDVERMLRYFEKLDSQLYNI